MSDDRDYEFDRRTVLKATGAASAAGALGGVASATPNRSASPKEDEVLVGVSAGRDLVETVAPAVPSDAAIVHANDTLRYVAVKFPEANGTAQQNFIESVQQRDGVKFAEVNETHEAFFDASDPKEDQQYAIEQVQAEEAWDTTLGCSEVTVAVVDTGCQYDHPDLIGNYKSNPGYDMVDNDSDPYPDDTSSEYHGSHVSGCASAVIDNDEGVAGIGNCSTICCRALDEDGSGSTSDIADCIEWAVDQGADIINLSLGGGGYTDTMKNAVSYAQDNGALVVAAAGNDGSEGVSYPAAYVECVAVSAVDASETLASFSQYGDSVELCAPGVDVLSTTTEARGSYEKLSGTSMATPIVCGVACLTLCQWNLTNSELRKHLKGTAKDIGLSSKKQGCGQVNAYNAVTTDPVNRPCDCAANCSGGGGGGSCGDSTDSASVSDSLSSYTDSDCWTYAWTFSDPCEVVVELSGPSDADFDLYVNDGTGTCPTTSSYDYRSWTTGSQESITIDNPDTSTDLYVLVDSYSGSGDYTLDITEKST